MKKVWDKWPRIALVKRIMVGLILGAILGIAVPQDVYKRQRRICEPHGKCFFY